MGGHLALQVPVHVVVSPPGGLGEYQAVWGPLETVLAVLKAGTADRVPLPLDQVFPSYRVDATRRTQPSPAP